MPRLFPVLIFLTYPFRWLWAHGRVTYRHEGHGGSAGLFSLILAGTSGVMVALTAIVRWVKHHPKFQESGVLEFMVFCGLLMAAGFFLLLFLQHKEALTDDDTLLDDFKTREAILRDRAHLMKTLPTPQTPTRVRRL
jgi:hypothetical protein